MPYYDPALEALIAAVLESLDHDADMTHGYTDQLRQLDVTLRHILQDPDSHALTPEQDQQLRQALGVLDAKAGDAALDALEVLRRLQAAVERELFRWDSSIVQPVGFSGESQIPLGGGEWETHPPGLSDAAVLQRYE